jgi:hypothetical protein
MSVSPRIVLRTSKVAQPRIFRKNTKREAIADSYTLYRVTEVVCEFNERYGPLTSLYGSRLCSPQNF